MSELRVDTGSLQKRSAAFQAEADDHRAVAAGDAPGVETDIAGFGEISLMLHDAYRAAHALKQQAWNDHGAATGEHGNKISESAQGYDRRESDGVAALDHTEPVSPEPTIAPPSSGPAFKMHGPGIQEVVPGTGEVRPQMPPGVQADPAVGSPAPAVLNNGPVPAPSPGPMDQMQGGISQGPAMNPAPEPQKRWTPDGPVWVTPPEAPYEPPLSGPAPTHPA
ncbi:WXG100 family type VII secretion target [Mycobacteroides abscessus]|uniref:type VII secretion target n=1 Tax=Mycobacteroides abscessus TaxID=36809 RepID=UPI000944A882